MDRYFEEFGDWLAVVQPKEPAGAIFGTILPQRNDAIEYVSQVNAEMGASDDSAR